MAVWPVSHAEQFVTDLVDGQFIKSAIMLPMMGEIPCTLSIWRVSIQQFKHVLAIGTLRGVCSYPWPLCLDSAGTVRMHFVTI